MAARGPSANAKRRRFAEEYAKDFNATQAAIRAGYSRKSAKVCGSRLLTFADVRDHLAQIVAKASRSNEITVERTMREIASVAYGDVGALFDEAGNLKPIQQMDVDARAMIAGVEHEEIFGPSEGEGEPRRVLGMVRKVRLRDKLKGLDQCMSILAMHKSVNPLAASGLNLHIYPSTYKRPK